MEPLHRESRPILPRNLTLIAAAVLVATAVFMSFSEVFMGVSMPSWSVPVTWAVFIIVIVVMLVLRMDVTVTPESVEIRYAFRRIAIPRGEILDARCGELGEIRNYGNWNLKGVKHRAYTRIGDEEGVALKLAGKRVTVFSTSEPEAVMALVPRADPEPEAAGEKEE